MNARKTTWGIDPRWTRVESLDDDGQSLGVVSFERRTPPEVWLSPKHLRKRSMLYGMIATAAVWLIGIAARFVHKPMASESNIADFKILRLHFRSGYTGG